MNVVVDLDGVLRGAVLRRLLHAGHEPAADGVVRIAGDGGVRVSTDDASWRISHATLADDPAGAVFQLAIRICDGAPMLLGDDDRAPFRLAWSVDVAAAVVESLDTRTSLDASGPTIWTSASLVEALAAALGTTPRIVRTGSKTTSFRAPQASTTFGATRPGNEALHLRRLVDAASLVVAPDDRPREVALARRLLRAGVAP